MGLDWFSSSYSALDRYRSRESMEKKAANDAIKEIKANGWKSYKLAEHFKTYYENNTSSVDQFCSVYKNALKKKDAVDYVVTYIKQNKEKLQGFLKKLSDAYDNYETCLKCVNYTPKEMKQNYPTALALFKKREIIGFEKMETAMAIEVAAKKRNIQMDR